MACLSDDLLTCHAVLTAQRTIGLEGIKIQIYESYRFECMKNRLYLLLC